MTVDQLLDREILATIDPKYGAQTGRIHQRLTEWGKIERRLDDRAGQMADLRRRLARMEHQGLIHQDERKSTASYTHWAQGPKPCI